MFVKENALVFLIFCLILSLILICRLYIVLLLLLWTHWCNTGSQSPSNTNKKEKTRVLQEIKWKKERLGLEKEPDNFGLRTPCVGFTPLAPRASHPKLKSTLKRILTGKSLFNHCLLIHWVEPLYIGSYKVNFSDITDVLKAR